MLFPYWTRMKENTFLVTFIIIFSGYKTRSNEIRFHGSSSYIDIGKSFTFVCSSDVSPSGETAKFLLNQNMYISLRYITNLSACYAISATNVPPPYKCTDTCSCTTTNFTLTYTSNNTGNNYVVLFGCEMVFGLTNISKTLNVPVAHGPLSVDLNSPSHVWITESEPLSPIQCTADCVPNCTYTWNGSGRTFNGSLLEFSSVQKSQNGTYTCTASNSYGSNTTTVNILVQYAPLEITINPVNTSFDVVEAYQLGPVSCNATCYPECEIRWTGPRYSVTSYRLVIDTITRNQKGIFTCTANNRVGSLTKEIQVNVLYGPSIVSLYPSMANVIVNENGQLGPINCSSDCEPQCSYRWTGPGFYQSSSSLLIRDTQRNQNGTYMCIASNKYGQNTTNINVFVHYAPLEITINPVNTSFDVVEAYQLGPVSCNATCYPECEIQWTGPGYNVTSYRLVIDTITRNQKGIFICTAKNRVGSLTKEMQVNVLYGPSIVLLSPSLAIVIVNESGQLGPINCSSDCEPQCLYRWTRPGFNQSTSSLLIRDTQRNQNGSYMCIAFNKFGQRTISVNVIVHFGPNNIFLNPEISFYAAFDKMSFGPIICSSNCYPTCNHEWNGPGIARTLDTLYVPALTRSQSGFFECTASNIIGHMTKKIEVAVQYQPSNMSLHILGNSTVFENQTAVFQCDVDSNPKSNLTWVFKPTGQIIKADAFTQSSNFRIMVANCLHTGIYQCTASNQIGVVTYTSSQDTAFEVLCSVRVDNTRDQTNTTVRLTLNDSLNLYVYIIAYPKPSITWTFTNKETHQNRTLQGSNTFGISNHTSAIQLDKLDIHEFGYYTFEASNGIGDEFVRVFSVIYKQKPPRSNFVLLICKATSAILLWKSETDVTQMFLVQYKRSKESKYSYTAEISNKNLGADVVFTIDELLPATQYEFLVISRNDVGDSVSELKSCSTDAEQNQQRALNGLSTTSIAVLVVGISVALFAPLIACFYIRRKTKTLNKSERYTEFKTFSSPEKSEYDIIDEVVEESEEKKEDTYDNVNL